MSGDYFYDTENHTSIIWHFVIYLTVSTDNDCKHRKSNCPHLKPEKTEAQGGFWEAERLGFGSNVEGRRRWSA